MDREPKAQARRWRAFAVLAVSFFMTVVDLTIVNVALPTIGRGLYTLSTCSRCAAGKSRRSLPSSPPAPSRASASPAASVNPEATKR